MCNENSTVNSPRAVRSRNFSLTTYLNKSQVKDVLYRHDRQIKAYAYIEHNKDLNEDGSQKETHIHILIRTINNITVDNVRNWFKGYTDSNDLPINTLGQVMHDITASFDYLTHNTEQAKADKKYLYNDNEVISNDINFFKNNSEYTEDNITLAIMELCEGVPLKEVATKYGRDFIIHYQSIKMLFNDIQVQEGNKSL